MHRPKGYILLVITVLMAGLLVYSSALVKTAITAEQQERIVNYKTISSDIAEAGIEKALWCLNQTSGTNCGGAYGSNYSGESNIIFGGGIMDIAVSNISGSIKQIEAAAYYPNKNNTLGKTIIRTRSSINTDMASFGYAMQMGYGGIVMGNNATINGTVYSNGNIISGNGSEITGDVYVGGGTALAADQSWTEKNEDFVFAKTNPEIDIAQSFIPSISSVLNKVSVYIKKTSTPGNITVRIVNDNGGAPGTTTFSSAILSSSLISTNYGWIDVSFSAPPPLYIGTKYWLVLDASQSSTEYYTIGVDAFGGYGGGALLYAQVWSSGSWTGTGYDANFKVWLGGVETGIENLIVGGNAYAHFINNSDVTGSAFAHDIDYSDIGGNAHADSIRYSDIGGSATTTNIADSSVLRHLWCQTKNSTTVGGNIYCPYASVPPSDPGPTNLPISDAMITDWKTEADTGNPIGSQIISNNTSMGPQKINGDLTINTGKRLTLTGTVYVAGNIIIGNDGAGIGLDSSYGSSSGVIIADGNITVGNNAVFSGADEGSYLVIVSTKNSSTENAITMGNWANAAIFYAPYGIITLGNNAVVKSVCAYKLVIGNGLVLNYELGMDAVSFSSGPTGGWSELKGYWQIVE